MAAIIIVICIVFVEVRDKPGQGGESEKGRGSFKGWTNTVLHSSGKTAFMFLGFMVKCWAEGGGMIFYWLVSKIWDSGLCPSTAHSEC